MTGAPQKYTPNTSFASLSQNNPTAQQPGNLIDAELGELKAVTDAIIDRLAQIQRDDGSVANESIGYEQFKPEITVGLNAVSDWASGTEYFINNGVWNGSSLYRCIVAHTSSPVFQTDLDAGKWSLLIDGTKATQPGVDSATAEANAAAGSATQAANSATAAQASATAAAGSEANAAANQAAAATSEANAAQSATDAAGSAAAAQAQVVNAGLPDLAGAAGKELIRVKDDKSGYQFLTLGAGLDFDAAGKLRQKQMAALTFRANDGAAQADGADLTAAQAAAMFTARTRTTLTNGTGTYVTKPNCRYIIVRGVGGGGGGGGGGNGGGSGGTGGNTTFGTAFLVANGGSGGHGAGSGAAPGGTASGGDINTQGGDGPSALNESGASIQPFGPSGASGPFGGAGRGGDGVGNATAGKANTGAGGGAGAGATGNVSGQGGAAGGYFEKLISAPEPTYDYAVGAGGALGTPATGGNSGAAGGSGIIIIDEFYV